MTNNQKCLNDPKPLTMESLTTSGEIVSVGDVLPATSGSLTTANLPAYIGIDFGTSTTVVSVARLRNGELSCDTMPIRYKTYDGVIGSDDRIPTMIAYKDGKLLMGKGAEDLKYDLEKDTDIWYSFKMELGEDLGNKYYNSRCPEIKSPKDAARIFFKYLKSQIEKCVSATKYEYAVTIPASFEANQRKDLVEAIEANGMNVSRQSLIDEPNAAFLSTLMEDEKARHSILLSDSKNPKILVFDYGAGTCDVSILEVGLHEKGAYSKNIAISRFSKCGGDDIDRRIAKEVLLPQLLEQMGIKEDSLRENQRLRLVSGLRKTAEALKIEACTRVGDKMTNGVLPAISNSEEEITLNSDFAFRYERQLVTLHNPKMTLARFNDIMKAFLKKNYSYNDEFNSIFKSIDSAMRKSGCRNEDIDYVLLIGGSSYNPYVQYALRENFKNSEFRIPHDLQSHVSQGAAIHSVVYNGLGHNIINPISSEPILVITKGLKESKVLVPAGTDMPSDEITIDDLVTSTDGQRQIELPICSGSADRILSNFIIKCPDAQGFSKGEKVTVRIRFTADKILKGIVEVRGRSYEIDPLNPLSNERLDDKEAAIRRAQRAANNLASANGGRATSHSLKDLANAYSKAGQHLKAAETLEELNDLYPGSESLNAIALEYGQAGQKAKEIETYEKALRENPCDSTILFNLALTLKDTNVKRYQELMEKSVSLDGGKPCHLYEYGRWLYFNGNVDRANKLIDHALFLWDKKYSSNNMHSWDYSWYVSALEFRGEYATAHKIMAEGKETMTRLYEYKNLTETTYKI